MGGRWYERATDGSECSRGRVVAWDPPARVVLTWQLTAGFTYDPGFETELEIRFTPDGSNATRVDLEHRNLERYGGKADTIRTMFDAPTAGARASRALRRRLKRRRSGAFWRWP
jgi:uncharacterized protein YndB with AHSA1/START domain